MIAASGPWRSSGDWWTEDSYAKDEWDLEIQFDSSRWPPSDSFSENSILGQKILKELSLRSGRQPVAHGVSRGLSEPTLSPVPSPARRERGAEGGVRVTGPRAYALGYSMPPLTGLRKTGAHSNSKAERGKQPGVYRVCYDCAQKRWYVWGTFD